MAMSGQSMKVEVPEQTPGAAPEELSDLCDMLGLEDDTGASPGQVASTADSSERKGVLRPKPEDGDGAAPSPKKPRVKGEDGNHGATPSPRKGRLFGTARRGTMGDSPGAGSRNADVCLGCDRTRGVSPDFLVVGETCAWAQASGKGQWCRECWTCWRINYPSQTGLAYFSDWLKDPAHRRDFEQTLLAQQSLNWEGQNEVTRQDVVKRLGVTQWLWQGVDHQPFRPDDTEGFIRKWLVRLGATPNLGATSKDDVKAELTPGATPTRSRLAKKLQGLA